MVLPVRPIQKSRSVPVLSSNLTGEIRVAPTRSWHYPITGVTLTLPVPRCLADLRDAKDSVVLQPGQLVIEFTSGNAGRRLSHCMRRGRSPVRRCAHSPHVCGTCTHDHGLGIDSCCSIRPSG
jgi:hypothetical protein